MYVIAGVTGNTGAVAAETLLAAGQPVRVIVRSADKGAAWKARGAEVFVGNLEDPLALSKALEGARGAYLLIPPDMTHPAQLARGRRFTEVFVEALTRTPVPHVVLLSSIGADQAEGTGPIRSLHYAEQRLGSLPQTRLTALRPAYFMENLQSGFGPARDGGVLPALFAPDKPLEMVSTVDIGRAVAHALREPPARSEVVELSGPEVYSYADAARAVSAALGKPVAPLPVPAEAVVPALVQAGLSADLAGLYLEMSQAIDRGLLVFQDQHRRVRGKDTLTARVAALLGR